MDSIINGIKTIGQKIINIGETILGAIVDALGVFVGMLLYYIEIAECKILYIVWRFFEVFAGLEDVKYYQTNLNNQKKLLEAPLINIFFQQSVINQIYWSMAIIGIAMAIAFTMWAVIKKMGDLGDKEQRSLGQIMGSFLKSVLIILSMNIIITVTLQATNALMQSINDIFNDPSALVTPSRIEFTDDEYYTMNQIYQTIGAYSLNPAYNSRYNINSCYNAIRDDLQYLYKNGTFNFYYVTQKTVVVDGVKQVMEIDTWQSVLQNILRARNIDSEISIDYYDENVSNAILYAMEVLRTNNSFAPLKSYTESYKAAGTTNVDIDVIIFLSATGDAAKNSVYNSNVSLTDPVRGPYYVGEKSIYSYSTVSEDFDMSLTGIDHLIILIMCVLVGKELVRVILACIVRIFQMLVLYIAAPPIVAIMPLDGGKKFQEWCTAFIVQAFGIFGTVITMRLLMIYIPICVSSDLILFDNSVFDLLAKVLLIYGGTVAANRSAAMITGILANNAGLQAVQAGDVRGEADQMMKSTGIDKAFGAPLGLAMKAAGGAAGLAADVSGLSTVGDKLGSAARGIQGGFNSARQGLRNNGGILGAGVKGVKNLAGAAGAYKAYRSGAQSGGAQIPGNSSGLGSQDNGPSGMLGQIGRQIGTNGGQEGSSSGVQPTNNSGLGKQDTPEGKKDLGGVTGAVKEAFGVNYGESEKGTPINNSGIGQHDAVDQKTFDNLFGAGTYSSYMAGRNSVTSGNGDSKLPDQKTFDNLFGAGTYSSYTAGRNSAKNAPQGKTVSGGTKKTPPPKNNNGK